MRIIIFFILSVFVFLVSCKDTVEINKTDDPVYCGLEQVDSINIIYFESISGNQYIIKYTKADEFIEVTIVTIDDEKSNIIRIDDVSVLNRLFVLINDIFIDKNVKVINSKSVINPKVMARPNIEIRISEGNVLIVDESIQIGEEGYHIEYSKQFIEFYSLLINFAQDYHKYGDK